MFDDTKKVGTFIRIKFLIFRGIFVYVLIFEIYFYFKISPKVKFYIKLKKLSISKTSCE